MQPEIEAFFHEDSNTVSYVVSDPETRRAAVIDSVLDYDMAAGRTATSHADRILAHLAGEGLALDWILETHVHADHLSAAPYLRDKAGGRVGIGARITEVQHTFGEIYNAERGFARDGSQFDHLFADGEAFMIGGIECEYLSTPGHTPACGSYRIDENIFVGDTLFMPDFGTARCDFPGGDARTLYRSIRRILDHHPQTTLWICHDYKAPGREEFAWRTTVGAQREANPHVRDGVSEDEFVAMREAKDAKLGAPKLLIPSIQVNMRAGKMPPAEDNGVTYLKTPVNVIGR
ncbi:MBL fold metallo-hydrolase [Pikeienuella piscinae]|uniref:MBL fold metallo-hydrolase n=1 Tax=Pikeienuella piscinae TaxID=2748098 RepID=A0A7L5C1F0_9RHOB|nr:MBL fold metallo-hydrolase [Pikeienuella piscinae]QIE56958.1 MBL fold metallo-hydrolase [Pikeienuella piscinae]